MRRLLLLAPLALLLAAGACQRKEEPKEASPPATASISGFQSEASFDAAGYYQPLGPIQFGNFKLTHIAVGAPSDFASWQEGRREGVFGPIWFEFEDVTSPTDTNELGGEAHTVRARIVPSAYVMRPGVFEFTGSHPALGEVRFKGALDAAALEKARDGHDTQMIVLTGDLQAGAQSHTGASFGFWAGD